MIDPPKAAITPWDAAASFGNTEKAFDHLKSYHPYGQNTPRTQIEKVAKTLDSTLSKKDPLDNSFPMTSGPGPKQPKMPEYSRKIKPWNASGGSYSPVSDITSPSMLIGVTPPSKLNFNPQIKPWGAVSPSSEASVLLPAAAASNNDSSSAGGKIKPVKFMASQGTFGGNPQPSREVPGYGPVNGTTNGLSAPGASAAAPPMMPSPTPSAGSYHSVGAGSHHSAGAGSHHSAANSVPPPQEISEDAGVCDL